MTTSSVIIFVVIFLAIVVSFLLVHMARLSSQTKIGDDQKKKRSTKIFPLQDNQPINKVVYDGVNRFVRSPDRCQEISQYVTEVFNKELEKRVTATAEELNKKHESVIKEKTHSEEVAWKKYQKVLTDKKTTESVIRSIAEGLVVVDAQGNVVVMNPAAEKLLGVNRKEKVGRPITDGLKNSHLATFVKGNNKESGEIEVVSEEDETKKVIRASTAVIENENGQTVGMVSVLSDVTKQKELDHLKNEFVSKVSHELRTPLIAIQKAISLIFAGSTGQLTDTQKQFLAMAERNLDRLSLLINDLLDLAKLEAGKMQLKREYQSIDKIIAETVDTLQHWAKTKAIALGMALEEKLPEVNVDAHRITQVLTNLIGNAIKFTPVEGIVTVKASAKHEKAEVIVAIEDNGIGIEKADLEKVFDKFQQVGERAPTDIAGTGLGLSVAKEIVELHGGRIWAESEKGTGTRFIFTIPMT